MKRTIISAAILALIAGGAGVSAAAGPGPNGSNNFGLCNAYFQGSAQGKAMKREHGKAFIALEEAAGVEEGDSYEEAEQKVRDWCAANAPKPGNGGGTGGKSEGKNPNA